MPTYDINKRFYQGANLVVEDLLLLEAFQIGYMPGMVPKEEFASVLEAHPYIRRFLEAKCPESKPFLEEVATHDLHSNDCTLAECEDHVVWTIADLLVYNKCPEVYDSKEFHQWDFGEVTAITPLKGKFVVDVGAGTGRVALEAAETAEAVLAVEPVANLRRFMRTKAEKQGLENLFVSDGFMNYIPLRDASADVLITSHAFGWRTEEEFLEMQSELERVVRSGGFIIHCPGTAEVPREDGLHQRLVTPGLGYDFARFQLADGWKRKYWKQV